MLQGKKVPGKKEKGGKGKRGEKGAEKRKKAEKGATEKGARVSTGCVAKKVPGSVRDALQF
jgi:hypothetical protein